MSQVVELQGALADREAALAKATARGEAMVETVRPEGNIVYLCFFKHAAGRRCSSIKATGGYFRKRDHCT